jgi:hypothetical protein
MEWLGLIWSAGIEWLVLFGSAVASTVGLFVSTPERLTAAIVTAGFTLLVGGWQSYQELGKTHVSQELLRPAIGQLLLQLRGFLEVLSEGLVRGSDQWLPQTVNEFFSPRTAEVICRELNIERSTPIDPPRPYDTWLDETSQRFRAVHRQVRQEAGHYLDADLIRAIGAIEKD